MRKRAQTRASYSLQSLHDGLVIVNVQIGLIPPPVRTSRVCWVISKCFWNDASAAKADVIVKRSRSSQIIWMDRRHNARCSPVRFSAYTPLSNKRGLSFRKVKTLHFCALASPASWICPGAIEPQLRSHSLNYFDLLAGLPQS